MTTHASRLAILASLLIASACGSVPERSLSTSASRYATLPNGNDPMNPEQLSPLYDQLRGGSRENATRALERRKGRPLRFLSLSGGGQNGAFGAGFLKGWRERGDRPEFDGVGGVSTGALLATHALLGTPEDDALLEEMYTTITQEDICTERSVFTILAGTDALMDTTPLRELIAKYITADTLKRVAEAGRQDRFLFVGSTNVDYDQTWLWNMTMIAQEGDLELYRDVLLSSASFPIVFPPVEIDGHLFVDGAARSNLVVPGLSGDVRPGPPVHGPGDIYLIDNGRLDHPPTALRRALGDVAATTVSVMMNQSMQTALLRTYAGTKVLGYNFHLAAIPNDVDIGKDPLAFDPTQMRAAFDAGFELAKSERPWSTEPPASNDLADWTSELIEESR